MPLSWCLLLGSPGQPGAWKPAALSVRLTGIDFAPMHLGPSFVPSLAEWEDSHGAAVCEADLCQRSGEKGGLQGTVGSAVSPLLCVSLSSPGAP